MHYVSLYGVVTGEDIADSCGYFASLKKINIRWTGNILSIECCDFPWSLNERRLRSAFDNTYKRVFNIAHICGESLWITNSFLHFYKCLWSRFETKSLDVSEKILIFSGRIIEYLHTLLRSYSGTINKMWTDNKTFCLGALDRCACSSDRNTCKHSKSDNGGHKSWFEWFHIFKKNTHLEYSKSVICTFSPHNLHRDYLSIASIQRDVMMRPRGVRSIYQRWRRYGSTTLSIVSISSERNAASVVSHLCFGLFPGSGMSVCR